MRIDYCILVGLLLSTSSFAATQPTWPCVQRLVPTITPERFWTAPLPATATTASDETLDKLADQISTLSLDETRADELLDAYLKQHTKSKDIRTKVYLAVFSACNSKRNEYIDSITTFSESQKLLADKISKQIHELENSALTSDKKQEQEEQHQWDLRVYTQREATLQLLCEKPTLIEQRLALIAKRLQGK